MRLPTHIPLDRGTDLILLEDKGDGDVLFAVRFYDTGEIREQLVTWVNFHPKWADTVKKRAANLERNDWTPQLLVPRKAGGRS